MGIKENMSNPAPSWWRKLENGLLVIIIPSALLIIEGWDLNEEISNKAMLIISVGLTAVVKFIGMMLRGAEVYSAKTVNPDKENPGGKG